MSAFAPERRLTAREEVLLAAAELAGFEPAKEFTEWDLTVAAWKLNPQRWGLSGYETLYPNHKRVMNELMAAGTERIVGRGWLERTSTNRYRLTPPGLAKAMTLTSGVRGTMSRDLAVYDSVAPLAFHRVFENYLANEAEPRIWLGAAAFLGLTKNDPQLFERRLRAVKDAISDALRYLGDKNLDSLRRGDSGKVITRERLLRLQGFVEVLEGRFAAQIASLRSKA